MKIIIKNIGSKVTADSLAAVFATYGTVVSSTILPNAQGATVGNSAVVFMPNEQEAAEAIEQLNGCFVNGQAWQVEEASATRKPRMQTYYKRVRGFLSFPYKTASFFI